METLKELLVGKPIVDVIAGSRTFTLILSGKDGQCEQLVVSLGGGPGADANWYTFPVAKLDGKEIWRG